MIYTLPETNIASENTPELVFQPSIFKGVCLLVSGRVYWAYPQSHDAILENEMHQILPMEFDRL